MTDRKGDQNGGNASQRRAPRRSAPSPRIQALADRFQSNSSIINATESREPVQRTRSNLPASSNESGKKPASTPQPHTSPSYDGLPSTSESRHPHVVMGSLAQMNWEPINRDAGPSSPASPSSPKQKEAKSTVKVLRNDTHIPGKSRRKDIHDTKPGRDDRVQDRDIFTRKQTHMQPSPAQVYEPSVRKVHATPVEALRNISLEAKTEQKQKRIDGLPDKSDRLPGRDSRESTRRPSPHIGPGHAVEPPSPSSPDDDGSDKDATDDDKSLLDKDTSSIGRHSSPQLQAVPACEVFNKDALPLFLPQLDKYLSDTRYFRAPEFSDTSSLCSGEEKILYGLDDVSNTSPAKSFEVCGDQISLPFSSIARDGLRKRSHLTRSGEEIVQAGEGEQNEDNQKNPFSDSMQETVAGTQELKPSPRARPNRGTAHRHLERGQSQVFAPLMLLKNATLDELKSNAIGPRKAPGGLLGSLPGIGSILGTIVDFVVGVEGSTLAAGIFRLQMLIDFVQIMHLNTHFTNAMRSVSDDGPRWNVNYVLLSVVPSMLSLDFVSVFGAAMAILFSFVLIVAVLLALFWRMTRLYNPNGTLEGYDSQTWLYRLVSRKQSSNSKGRNGYNPDDQVMPWRSTVWTKFANISIVMLLTVFYIPLSKLAMDALVWNIDYWPIHPKDLSTLTTAQGVCYRTTLESGQFNWAYVIIPVAASTVLVYTLWFPYMMMRTIQKLLPRINEFNELGNRRSKDEMETEYMRMLNRDHSPLSFMYNAYRRRWGTYKPLYILCFKFSNLLTISVFTQQNCLFHTVEVKKMLVIQQSVLISLQATLLVVHIFVQPFIDMLSNRSEMMSRTAYVLTAIIGLLVALQVQGSTVYQSVVLYIVQGLTYTINIYFSCAGSSWMSHLVKRLQRRIDFSVDIFSPTLLLDKHVKRRVWQETLSTILLSGPEYRMPIGQLVTFSVDDNWPPYLLQFQGTAAERHVENLKILKAIGMDAYRRTNDDLRTEVDAERWKALMKRIHLDFAGPDAYWQPLNIGGKTEEKAMDGVSSYFGKAFLIPFPPTIVMSYDQNVNGGERGSTIQLTSLAEFEQFVWQNESEVIQKRRWVRMVLRSLDGQNVRCPHVETQKISAQSRIQAWLGGLEHRQAQYSLAKPVYYEEGTLSIERKTTSSLGGNYSYESGFDVFITYSHGQRRDADGMSVDRRRLRIDAAAAFGLRDDFDFTVSVDRFFRANEAAIVLRLPQVRQLMQSYRLRFFREALEKRKTLNYAFLTDIFDHPVVQQRDFEHAFHRSSNSTVVRSLPQRYPAATRLLLERMHHIDQTRIHKWWYIFWDDFWRQNNGDYLALRRHRRTFHVHYPSSIAYTPMSRDKLESLLKSKAGLWRENDANIQSNGAQKAQKGLFNRGLLNRIYFTLNELAFDKSVRLPGERGLDFGKGVPLMVGTLKKDGTIAQRPLTSITDDTKTDREDWQTSPYYRYSDPFAANSRHTGGGTDHDVQSIVERYAWPWTEERLSGQPSTGRWPRLREKTLEWLSIRPYKLHDDVTQLYIYLRIVDGRYVASGH